MKVRDRFDKNRIGELVCDGAFKYVQNFAVEINGKRVAEYGSLDGVAEEWEDYQPAEPLIKDEMVRKAVRAWAEAESEECYYGQDATTLYNGSGDHIEFWSRPFKDLTPYEHYTIAELCGEEEE